MTTNDFNQHWASSTHESRAWEFCSVISLNTHKVQVYSYCYTPAMGKQCAGIFCFVWEIWNASPTKRKGNKVSWANYRSDHYAYTNTQQDTSPTSESQAKRLPAVLVGIGLSSTKPDADQILQW